MSTKTLKSIQIEHQTNEVLILCLPMPRVVDSESGITDLNVRRVEHHHHGNEKRPDTEDGSVKRVCGRSNPLENCNRHGSWVLQYSHMKQKTFTRKKLFITTQELCSEMTMTSIIRREHQTSSMEKEYDDAVDKKLLAVKNLF